MSWYLIECVMCLIIPNTSIVKFFCSIPCRHFTLFSKRNATFLTMPFFWRPVYASETGVIHHFDNAHGDKNQKPHLKIDHGSLTIVKCLSTSHRSDFAKLNSLRN